MVAFPDAPKFCPGTWTIASNTLTWPGRSPGESTNARPFALGFELEQAHKDRLQAEVAELQAQRRELCEAIAAEAGEHNLEWVDDGGDDGGLAPTA